MSRCRGCEDSKRDPAMHTCLPAEYQKIEKRLRETTQVELTCADMRFIGSALKTSIEAMVHDEKGRLLTWNQLSTDSRDKIRRIKYLIEKLDGYYNSVLQ